jgi:hypothetical protein
MVNVTNYILMYKMEGLLETPPMIRKGRLGFRDGLFVAFS